MSFYEVNVTGYPDKKSDDPTRLYFPVTDWKSKTQACDLTVHYGGLFQVQFQIVDLRAIRGKAEMRRVSAILNSYQGNREH
jgi:hypothetical protein